MNKQKLLVIVNVFLGVVILIQLTTAILMGAFGFEWAVEFHEANGIALFVLAAVHIFLNWAWIKKMIFKQ